MIVGLGSDLVDIRRIDRTLGRFGDRFIARVFTEEERRKADLERLSLEANAAREFAKAGRAVGEAAAIGRTLSKLYAEWEGILD